MIFKKYEFTDEQWATIRPTLYTPTEKDGEVLIPAIQSIVEIGHICFAWSEGEEPVCTDLSTMYAVDMLLNEPVDSLDDYIVWPDPVGVHTFAGDDSLYLKGFCIANPDSPFCVIPDEDIS
jgi:hypothetical protein